MLLRSCLPLFLLYLNSLPRNPMIDQFEKVRNGASDFVIGSSFRDRSRSQHSIAHCSGYIGSVSFLNTVLEVVKKLRSINPKLTYVCDPVLGDEGKLYVPPELVAVYREKVVPVASMLTFEAEQLTGFRIVSEHDGREACNKLHAAGPAKVVITSINIDGHLLLIGSHEKEKGQSPDQFKIVIPRIPAYFTVRIL
uniref:pyridoxal kinase n=1 Tax=Salix viminalis TaxID=40686 RepID=A0A6N2NE54_SALVM